MLTFIGVLEVPMVAPTAASSTNWLSIVPVFALVDETLASLSLASWLSSVFAENRLLSSRFRSVM